MALHWLWSEKCGEAIIRQNFARRDEEPEIHEFTLCLYKGNAQLIFLYEYTDEETGKAMYSMNRFWADETHMKRMLGLDKKYKETYGENQETDIVKFIFYKGKHSGLKKMVSAIAEAYDNIEIVITNSTDKGGK